MNNNMKGSRFGRWVVLCKADSSTSPKGKKVSRWHCLCDCGNLGTPTAQSLRSRKSRSCGCYQKEIVSRTIVSNTKTHGMSNTRLYYCWKNMKARCYNVNSINYPMYGGRGIKVCQEWLESFEVFSSWAMSKGYDEKLTIDRIDNDGNYEPSNC